MATTWKWSFPKLVMTIVATLLNRYDFFLAIEGITGSGKSSCALGLCIGVKREFKKLKELDYDTVKKYYEFLNLEAKGTSEEEFCRYLLELKENKAYEFKFSKHIIYQRDNLLQFLDGWRGIAVSDEAVNTMFNRDFTNEDQKNIVKVLNMMRDHNNFLVACIPNFKVLDNQVRDLCKMRLSIVRRGIAVIQTPNKTFYGSDKWDSKNNEKVEREWLLKKTRKPKYARLTTFRGLVKFPKLSPKIEEKYQKVKNKKRTQILKEGMGIEVKKEMSFEDDLVDRLTKGGIKNMQVIEGIAIANGITLNTLRSRVRRKLIDKGVNPLLSSYFYDRKARQKGDTEMQSIT